MRYENIKKAEFISRPNRFIAMCMVDGRMTECHVKNTGRCKELLVPGATVFLEKSSNSSRKTDYDLVAVYNKNNQLFNIDSQAPNKVFGEWLEKRILFKDLSHIKAEVKYKDSRLDFYVAHGDRKAFIEVKGVTLEKDGVMLFPDAPTERGIKHIHTLCDAVACGYEGYIAFVIQTNRAKYCSPNRQTHPQFADALKAAQEKGVQILSLLCKTEPDLLEIKELIPFRF